MADPLPLPTLLSQALVAHTIELDNEAEHRLPHRTSRADDPTARRDGPWLISSALWRNTLAYVDRGGTTVAEIRARARTGRLLLGGLQRWGYVTVSAPPGERLKHPPQDGAVVRPTESTEWAAEVWRAMPAVLDGRWRARFGDQVVRRLETALGAVFDRLPVAPPAYLPVVHPTQNGRAEPRPPCEPGAGGSGRRAPGPDLSELLSGVLLAFTLDFERESRVSMAIGANTLRVLDRAGVRLRDLPRVTGVSKEANAMCAGWLGRRDCALTGPDPGASRGKVLRLTHKGEHAQRNFRRSLGAVEQAWRSAYGASAVDEVRAALEPVVGDGTLASSPLAGGLEPHPDNWRAALWDRPDTLPHYPMVLHRGGYPDGS
jgi:hypothetical protein